MGRKANQAIIGAFVLGAVLLAVAGVFVLSGDRFFFAPRKTHVAYFDGSLEGLDIGAPVTFNGVRIGSVTDVKVVIDADGASIRTPVFFDIDARRLHGVAGGTIRFEQDAGELDRLIAHGLRARLELQSLVTGQLVVALNFYPNTPARLRGVSKRYGDVLAVDKVDLSIPPGRTLGVVGESGCGKTMLSRAILQLLPKRAKLSGRVVFGGRDLLTLAPEALRRLRGPELAVVFQDPMTSLNPVLTIGTQLVETLQAHLGMDGAAATRRGIELLAAVGIPAPDQRMRQYPHQLSGGMRQRVAIAIALSCEPRLLIADEPTTALDVTIQAQILALMRQLQDETGAAILFVTHNLGVVAEIADQVVVMYAGRVV